MIIVFPAPRTRMASILSLRVSTPTIGSTIVRKDGIETVRYTPSANIYKAGHRGKAIP